MIVEDREMLNYFDVSDKDSFVYDVYLNGERQDFCKTANIKEGWIETYEFKANSKKKFEVVLNNNGLPKTSKLFGKVELRLNEFYFK